MVGLDNAGKTATAKGIQGGKLKKIIIELFWFIYLNFFITYSLGRDTVYSITLYS